MAVHYYLAVACADQAAATAMFDCFEGLPVSLTDGLTTSCWAKSLEDTTAAIWWSLVFPRGASINGHGRDHKPEPNLTSRAQRSKIGHLLYQRLQSAPAFRFARYGEEVIDPGYDGDHNIYYEAMRDPRDPSILAEEWNGLVLNEEMWEMAQRPDQYKPFRPGYYWTPYTGETRW